MCRWGTGRSPDVHQYLKKEVKSNRSMKEREIEFNSYHNSAILKAKKIKIDKQFIEIQKYVFRNPIFFHLDNAFPCRQRSLDKVVHHSKSLYKVQLTKLDNRCPVVLQTIERKKYPKKKTIKLRILLSSNFNKPSNIKNNIGFSVVCNKNKS